MTIQINKLSKVFRPGLIFSEPAWPRPTAYIGTWHSHCGRLHDADASAVDLIADQINETLTGHLASLLILRNKASLNNRRGCDDRYEDTTAEVLPG